MAEFRLTFRTYAIASTFCVLALVLRTWYIHEELYTVVAVLTTQKVALAVLYNFVFMILVGAGKLVLHVLLGQLRDLEVEQVLDSGRGFLLDTVLFLVLSSPTLDGADVSTYALAKFLLLLVALKTAHLVVQIRGATMFEVGHPRVPALLRVCLVLSALLSMDLFAVHFFLVHASRQSTFYLWLLFECLGMLASCAICVVKFGVHLVDVRLDNGWTSKSAVIFYLELVHDVTSLGIFLLFMTVFFVTQPSRLPLYMTADIIHVVKALYKRILSLKKYRSLTRNLETRFPDATPEELEAADTCIICRDFLFDGSKKLPCSHIFHIDCLRSWLVQQQSCPTCRAEIPTDDASTPAVAAAASSGNVDGGTPVGRNRGAQQQQRRSRGGSVASQAGLDGATSARVDSSAGSSGGASGGFRQERSPACAAAAASSTVDEARTLTPGETAAGGQNVRSTGEDIAGYLHNTTRDLNEAEEVSDPLALLDMRVKRSSERIEAAAATALAAAASAAAAARPAVRGSLPRAAYRPGKHDEQLEAALRQRVMQTEAVVTDALAQALALSYHMCDVYRLHASLWTVEAQHAQLEVCRKLLQQTSELRRRSPPAPVSRTDVSAVEGKFSPSASLPVYTGSRPAAVTGMASAATASDASSSTSDVKKPQQRQQDDVQETENACRNRTPLQLFNVNKPPVKKETLVENRSAVEQPGAVATRTSTEAQAPHSCKAGETGGYDGFTIVDGEVSRELTRREVGRTELRENNEKEYVLVCPSHLFQQGNLPCVQPHNVSFPVAPFSHGGDGGHPFNDDLRVEKNHTVVSDMHSSSDSSFSSHHDSLAMLGASNPLSLGAYGIAAATGHCPFCGPRNAAPETWQNTRGVDCSGLLPRPLFTDSSLLHTGVGESAAQHHLMSPPSNNLPAAAGAEHGVITSADQGSSSSSEKPFSGENIETYLFPLFMSLRANVDSPASSGEIREEASDNFSGSSPNALLLAEEVVGTAPAEPQDRLERPGSSVTGAETFEGGTNAMAAELDRLRKEQHRRWKCGVATDNGSCDV